MNRSSVSLIIAIALAAGCICMQPHAAAQTHAAPADPAAYVIGSGDEIEITVLAYPELSTRAVVLPDGFISFPFLTRVNAAGSTIEALKLSLQESLDQYIYNPHVTVSVLNINSKRFSVLGEVTRPGVFTISDMNMTLYEAIAQAQGFLPTAYKEQVSIMRPDRNGRQTALTVDMAGTKVGDDGVFQLRLLPGDIVYVPGPSDKRHVCVIGKVSAPGRYAITSGMTVVDVITAAGWVTKEGTASSVMLVRRRNGRYMYSRVNANAVVAQSDDTQDIALEPGDIVYVPEHFISKISTFVGFFTSSVEPLAHTYLRVYDATDPASYVVDR